MEIVDEFAKRVGVAKGVNSSGEVERGGGKQSLVKYGEWVNPNNWYEI